MRALRMALWCMHCATRSTCNVRADCRLPDGSAPIGHTSISMLDCFAHAFCSGWCAHQATAHRQLATNRAACWELAFAGCMQQLQNVFRHTLRMFVMSEPLRTKDAAMKSMSLISPHCTRSSSSFFVKVGRSTMTPGRFTFLRSLHAINHVRQKSMKWQADILALFAWLGYVSKAH